MRKLMLIGLCLLAGCVNRIAEREALAGQFIGRSEADLVRDAGPPARAVDAGGRRFIVYEERRVDFIQQPGGFMGPRGFYRPYYGGAFPPQAVESVCETSFEITAGRVSNYSLRGNAC